LTLYDIWYAYSVRIVKDLTAQPLLVYMLVYNRHFRY
jgi:hypothetical protein